MANLLCIGDGHVGGPTMAVIAQKCPEHRVVVADINAEKIAAWQSDRLPSATRESPALQVCRALLEERAEVVLTDPHALDNARVDLGEDFRGVIFEPDPYAAAMNARAIALLTEWTPFSELDYEIIFHSMTKPAFFFDGRNILDHRKLFQIGFNVHAIGKPSLIHP